MRKNRQSNYCLVVFENRFICYFPGGLGVTDPNPVFAPCMKKRYMKNQNTDKTTSEYHLF